MLRNFLLLFLLPFLFVLALVLRLLLSFSLVVREKLSLLQQNSFFIGQLFPTPQAINTVSCVLLTSPNYTKLVFPGPTLGNYRELLTI
jgi:hypothetical protein